MKRSLILIAALVLGSSVSQARSIEILPEHEHCDRALADCWPREPDLCERHRICDERHWPDRVWCEVVKPCKESRPEDHCTPRHCRVDCCDDVIY